MRFVFVASLVAVGWWLGRTSATHEFERLKDPEVRPVPNQGSENAERSVSVENVGVSQVHDRDQCKVELQDLKRASEAQAIKLATLKGLNRSQDELLKLSIFAQQFTQYQVTLGVISSHIGGTLNEPFSVCLPKPPQSPLREGDLVTAQGVLLGEVSKVADRCVTVRPTVSEESSFEVQFAQSGVRGVAVGLGAQSEEEVMGASLKLKYLERTEPAQIGERVYLVSHPRKSALSTPHLHLQKLNALPTLVVGEVIQAHLKENGLFQEAMLTTPLRRSGVTWVSIISPLKEEE